MRRTFPFCVPTLFLSLVTQVLGSFLLWLSYMSIVGQALAAAPITPSGLNTQVSGPIAVGGKTQFDITGGTRPAGGTNLFHSFGDFNVPNNNIANFLNDSGLATSNILGRVTGGNISNIFGTVQTTGFGGANLFLMNPAGIVFGPNATLNVGGSVTFTTANYLRLADNVLFNAIPNAASDTLLSAAPVAAFGFLGSNAEAITVQGSQLTVTPGQSISLVGGNITVQSGVLDDGITVQPARLSAPNGQINLATAASPGEFLLSGLQAGGIQAFAVTPQTLTSLAGPNVNGTGFTSFGLVHLAKGSTVDTSQTGNSQVSIRSGQFVLDVQDALLSTSTATPPPLGQNNILISPGSSIVGATLSADRGPDVQIIADTINVSGTPPGRGPPNFAFIRSIADASGDAGNISLMATHNIDATASNIGSVSAPASNTAPIPSGNSGNISLTSTEGNISLTSFTQVASQSSSSTGNTGNLTLNAIHGDILLDSTALFSSIVSPTGFIGGSGGGIQITANNLTLRHSSAPPAGISIDNFNPQVPGNIRINLSGNLTLDGQSFIQTIARGPALAAADIDVTAHNVSIANGSFLNTQTISSGRGGTLSIFADNVQLTNGGQLRSGSISGPDPLTGNPTIPSGAGGTINIEGLSGPAVSLLIDGAKSGIFTNAVGTGPAGNTNIVAQSLTIQNGGTITASTSGTAPSATGGTIMVKADTVTLTTGGTMTAASTGAGASGEVIVQGPASAAQSILIDGAGSGILTDTHSTGAGGDIHLSSNSVALQNGGTLSATTSGTSASAIGGSISVNATDGVTMTNGGLITASSTGPGNAGNISINAGQQLQMQNSSITTTASQASGGNIEIQAIDQVRLVNSTISTSVLGGSGSGGNITIDPNSVILQNSQIIAQAIQGAGGNITIVTPLFLADQTSIVDASSEFGLSGTVNIQNPTSNLAGSIASLPSSLRQVQSLQTGRCAALYGDTSSSFVVAGRETIPTEPGGWEVSPMASLNAGAGLAVQNEAQESSLSARVPVDQEIVSLRRLTPAGFLTQHFAENPATGCRS